jgi:uncharacterized phiE125 gp8 family phage protein
MALKLITAATTYPVSLAEAKLHAKVDAADDDALITAFITAATEVAEQKIGRAIMPQTWELTLDAFPDAFELTRTPVTAVTNLTYYDTSGVQQTLLSSLYTLNNADADGSAYVVPVYNGTWPDTRTQVNAVTLRYTAGYANAAAVPEPIKTWIKIAISTMYQYRESEVVERATLTNMGFVDRLLDRYLVTTT